MISVEVIENLIQLGNIKNEDMSLIKKEAMDRVHRYTKNAVNERKIDYITTKFYEMSKQIHDSVTKLDVLTINTICRELVVAGLAINIVCCCDVLKDNFFIDKLEIIGGNI